MPFSLYFPLLVGYHLSSSFGCLETHSGMYGSRRKGQANLRDVSHLLFGGVGGNVVDRTS